MRLMPIAAALATLVLTAPLAAQDISGTWELSWETPRGAQTVVFTFAQDGTTLTGSAVMTMGRPGAEGRERTVEISNGMVEAEQVAFDLVLGGPQRSFTMSFTGAVTGDSMEGTVTNPRGGANPFTGTRKEA